MEFTGERGVEASKPAVWEIISQPDSLLHCIPGARDVTRKSETNYSGVIERSFAGLTVNLDGEVEMVRLDEPDSMELKASGLDRITKTEMNAEGTLDLRDTNGSTTLDYDVTMEFTGKLPAHLLKSRINKDIGRFFDNIKTAAEDGLEAVMEETEPEPDEAEDEDDSGGLLSRF